MFIGETRAVLHDRNEGENSKVGDNASKMTLANLEISRQT